MLAARSTSNPAADSAIRVAGFEKSIVPTVVQGEGDDASIVELVVPGTWQGLHVTRLHVATWGTDDVSTLQVHFREGPDEARAVLRQLGFPLAKVGELATAGEARVGIEAVPDGSALTCARDARADKTVSARNEDET